jgi:hypothetical protein
MNTKRFVLSALAVWIFGIIWTFLTCAGLFKWVYEIPPIIWKTPEAMMTAGNTIGSLIVGLIAALIFTMIYATLYRKLPIKGVKGGMLYGFFVWLIAPFVGVVSMPFYMTIATTVVVYWLLNFLVSYLIMGLIVGAIYKEGKK